MVLVLERGAVQSERKGTFAGWLRGELSDAGMSQVDLAKKLGVSLGMVQRYVAGVSLPSAETCDRLARILYVDPLVVRQLAGHSIPPGGGPLDPERAAWLAAYDELPEDRREILRRILRGLRES